MELSKEALILVKNGLNSAVSKAEDMVERASRLINLENAKLNEPAIEYFKTQEKKYIGIANEIRTFRDKVD